MQHGVGSDGLDKFDAFRTVLSRYNRPAAAAARATAAASATAVRAVTAGSWAAELPAAATVLATTSPPPPPPPPPPLPSLLPPEPPLPPRRAFGEVALTDVAPLLQNLDVLCPTGPTVRLSFRNLPRFDD